MRFLWREKPRSGHTPEVPDHEKKLKELDEARQELVSTVAEGFKSAWGIFSEDIFKGGSLSREIFDLFTKKGISEAFYEVTEALSAGDEQFFDGGHIHSKLYANPSFKSIQGIYKDTSEKVNGLFEKHADKFKDINFEDPLTVVEAFGKQINNSFLGYFIHVKEPGEDILESVSLTKGFANILGSVAPALLSKLTDKGEGKGAEGSVIGMGIYDSDKEKHTDMIGDKFVERSVMTEASQLGKLLAGASLAHIFHEIFFIHQNRV